MYCCPTASLTAPTVSHLQVASENSVCTGIKMRGFIALMYCCPTASSIASTVLICKSLWIKASAK